MLVTLWGNAQPLPLHAKTTTYHMLQLTTHLDMALCNINILMVAHMIFLLHESGVEG